MNEEEKFLPNYVNFYFYSCIITEFRPDLVLCKKTNELLAFVPFL